MQAEDVARVLEAAVSAGKIRQIGVSNFLPRAMADGWPGTPSYRWCAIKASYPCSTPDPLFDGTLEAHLADGLRWLAWSPLGGGGLADRIPAELMGEAREETGLDDTGLAIAWLRQIPGTPIPVLGSMNPERIHSALNGARSPMPRGLWYRLLESVRNTAVA